jgi:hypothetical protein
VWVKPIVKAEVTRLGKQEGLSDSATGAALIEKAIQTNLDLQYSDSSIKCVDGFSGNAHPHGSRYLPKAQSEPENF